MYEGKNIHFSAVDNKPLCSYSSKICKQRRLSGYAFCSRHVLEDSSAPFKQCSFNTKNGQRCINPIPNSKKAEYCNIHLQHLGLAPSKRGNDMIKDVKEEPPTSNGISGDNKLRLGERLKNKFNLHQKDSGNGDGFDDDPYAFHDPDPPKLVSKTSPIIKPSPPPAKSISATLSKAPSPQVKNSTILGLSSASPEHNHVATNKVSIANPKAAENKGGTSSIAKLYPELAEKLERVRTKTDPKAKTSTKSSRTMNRLQTKIAQNKIKDKLKKTQGQSINSSCSTTPEQPGTPVAPHQVATNTSTVEHKPLISPVANSQLYANEAKTNISWTPNAVTTSFTQQMAPLSQSWPPATPPNIAMQFPMGPHLPLGKDNTHTPSMPYVPPYIAPDIKVPPFLPSVTPQTGVPSLQASLDSLSSSQPFPNQFPFQQHTPHVKPHTSRPSQLTTRAKRPKNVLSESEAKRKLRRHSAVKVYAYHASRRMNNMDLLPMGVDSSDEDSDFDDGFSCQQLWVTNSSDEEVADEDDLDEEITSNIRRTKLGLFKSKLRRQFLQLRKTYKGNKSLRGHNIRALHALLQSARSCADAATNTLKEIKLRANKIENRSSKSCDRHGHCLYTGSEQKKESCHEAALPFTNHCINHIMYNVDQQMFDYCTAKFSDNTQCCIPVFDIRHELPLCPEHAAKADNYQKNHEPKPKKPRKKTKPSALTRPPKKGKKKKNQKRNVRPQKPTPPLSPTGNTDLPPVFTPEASGTSAGESSPAPAEPASSGEEKPPSPVPSTAANATAAAILDANLPKEGELVDLGGDLEESFSPGTIGKDLDLPMDSEQAAKFLDEHDLHDVLNKLPDEAFDLITNKNGDLLSNEAELLEQAFAEASKVEFCDTTKDTLDKLSRHADAILIGETPNDDELTKQIADSLLNQNMASPAGSLSDDLSTDNLNALASSLSANDLKSISQVLTTSVINSALGSDSAPAVSQSSMEVDQTQILEHLQQGIPHGGIPTGQIPPGPIPQAPIPQAAPSQTAAGIGNFPIIQAQLAQGPMLNLNQQSPISTGAITSISVNGAPMSSMSKCHELFSGIVGNSTPIGMSRPADNVPSNTVAFPNSMNSTQMGTPQVVQLGNNQIQVPQGLEGILVPMANPATLNNINNGPAGVSVNAVNVSNTDMKSTASPNVNFQNGLPPINSAFHGQQLGPGGMGVKLAYPVQMLPGGMITGGNANQTLAISSQSSMSGQQLFTLSTSLPQTEQSQLQQTLPNV